FPQIDVQLWVGLFAPAATPATLVRRLEEELQKALKAPDLQVRFHALALTPGGASAAEMGPLMSGEIARWGEVVKRAGIKV
ncbi:tripartite tricarboxylate transporter substrate-binding protein, partial [Acinetobacter baumannii]